MHQMLKCERQHMRFTFKIIIKCEQFRNNSNDIAIESDFNAVDNSINRFNRIVFHSLLDFLKLNLSPIESVYGLQ